MAWSSGGNGRRTACGNLGLALCIVLGAGLGSACAPGAEEEVDERVEPICGTEWQPSGCRAVPGSAVALPSRAAWRNLHAGPGNDDEISIAFVPEFELGWVAEPETFNATGPVFDDAGNLYFSPLLPKENVALVSLEPVGGARRWSIEGTGALVGAGAPMMLDDPDRYREQVIYLGLKDRVLAVRTDGSVIWERPTGLTAGYDDPADGVFGVNYHPQTDSIVGLTATGHVYALRRASGEPLLAEPFELPGSASPTSTLGLPAALLESFGEELGALMKLDDPELAGRLIDVLLGNASKVANFFSIDPHTGRLWIAATAPDAEDGADDGVSELGALYGLDLAGGEVVEACHATFQGGSASTPALRADGERIYVGDDSGKLIAIDRECTKLWELDVGAQIVGSVGVSSDNRELYAATLETVVAVVDRDTHAEIVWSARPAVLEPEEGETTFNLLIVAIGQNGLLFQAGAGQVVSQGARSVPLPRTVGVGLLDRKTGAVRHFTEGLDESVAVASTGPDGAAYIGNSPVRRAFSRLLGVDTPPLMGGISQYAPTRLDRVVAEAACAGSVRARNAELMAGECPGSASADALQIRELVSQARRAAALSTELDAALRETIAAELDRAEAALDEEPPSFARAANALARVTRTVGPRG